MQKFDLKALNRWAMGLLSVLATPIPIAVNSLCQHQILRFSDSGRAALFVLRHAESCAMLKLPFRTSGIDWLITDISTDGDDVVISGIMYPVENDEKE